MNYCVKIRYVQISLCSYNGLLTNYYAGQIPLAGKMFPKDASWDGRTVKLSGNLVNGTDGCLVFEVTRLGACGIPTAK
jgi:hypothetical protein